MLLPLRRWTIRREQRVATFDEIAKEERVNFCRFRDTKKVCERAKKNKRYFSLVMRQTQEIL